MSNIMSSTRQTLRLLGIEVVVSVEHNNAPEAPPKIIVLFTTSLWCNVDFIEDVKQLCQSSFVSASPLCVCLGHVLVSEKWYEVTIRRYSIIEQDYT